MGAYFGITILQIKVKIVNKFKDERIKYYVSNNLKLYDARNLAINKASGQYISFIDTDDLWKT